MSQSSLQGRGGDEQPRVSRTRAANVRRLTVCWSFSCRVGLNITKGIDCMSVAGNKGVHPCTRDTISLPGLCPCTWRHCSQALGRRVRHSPDKARVPGLAQATTRTTPSGPARPRSRRAPRSCPARRRRRRASSRAWAPRSSRTSRVGLPPSLQCGASSARCSCCVQQLLLSSRYISASAPCPTTILANSCSYGFCGVTLPGHQPQRCILQDSPAAARCTSC